MTNEEAKKQIYDLKQYLNRSTAWYLNDKHKTALDMAISALSENKGDTVSRVAYEQIMWERDVAIQQLKDLGYGLGEKPKENKGEWIESKERSKHWYCSVCGGIHTDPETGKWRETFDYRYPFWPNCGGQI